MSTMGELVSLVAGDEDERNVTLSFVAYKQYIP